MTHSTHPGAVYSRAWRARLDADLEAIRAARPPWRFNPDAAPGEQSRADALAEIDATWFNKETA